MEHFKLDYSLSIFIPESGMKVDPIDRDAVSAKAGLESQNKDEPLLVSLLKQGGPIKSSDAPSRPATNTWDAQPVKPKLEPLKKTDALDNAMKADKQPTNKFAEKDFTTGKSDSKDDDYNDDFSQDIDEELPSDDEKDKVQEEQPGEASQSMGLDPSVNTLAMDDYDYVEEVIRGGTDSD